ncbi:hypothetical protein E2P71_05360 [Candidatus Bathyarchaeota archaeon]|nr:hypothetical protein E2P71_05360 [Candidatus Bathyarchaeota archaeon]
MFDSKQYRYEYDMILPLDVVKTNDGYILYAKFLAEDSSHEKTWRAGSVYVPGTIFGSSARVNTLFFKDLQGSSNSVDSVHTVFNPVTGRTMYFYADFDGYDHQGLTDGVCLGLVSDHLDVSEDLLTWP